MSIEKDLGAIDASINKINDALADATGGLVPLDGLVITSAVWFLSPPGDRLRNTLIVGGLHGFIHNAICKRTRPLGPGGTPPIQASGSRSIVPIPARGPLSPIQVMPLIKESIIVKRL